MSTQRLGAVVVAFNPDAGLGRRLAAIRPQVEALLIADNSPGAEARALVARAAADSGAELRVQPANLGIAGALNAAFRELRARGFTHALALDQDSTPAPDLVRALLGALTSPNGARLAVLGADWRDESTPGATPRHVTRPPWFPLLFRRRILPADTREPVPVSFAIMSGSCIDLAAWESLGGFDESLMLDLVDQEFCLRAQRASFGVAVLPGARLAHNRGAKRPVRFLGRTFHPSFMSPRRLRCMFHNRTRLFLPWLFRHPHIATHEAAYSAKILFDVCVLEGDSWAKLRAIAAGVRDALLHRPLVL